MLNNLTKDQKDLLLTTGVVVLGVIAGTAGSSIMQKEIDHLGNYVQSCTDCVINNQKVLDQSLENIKNEIIASVK